VVKTDQLISTNNESILIYESVLPYLRIRMKYEINYKFFYIKHFLKQLPNCWFNTGKNTLKRSTVMYYLWQDLNKVINNLQ
jgi:hypothetical protein